LDSFSYLKIIPTSPKASKYTRAVNSKSPQSNPLLVKIVPNPPLGSFTSTLYLNAALLADFLSGLVENVHALLPLDSSWNSCDA